MPENKDERFISQPEILQRYGISEMTLSRWRRDEHLNFPPPLTIRRRNFYKRAEIDAWEVAQAAKSARARGQQRSAR
jgi:predicted DNA-binding transcriptional regulator AlpA